MNKEFEKSGKKLTMLAFIIKASVRALQEFPEFNTSLDGDNLVYKKYFNIAFAADTPNGLVVPVIKDADKKSVFDIAAESGALAKKARDGKLGPADMSGACFTISSLGRHRRHLLRAHRQCARSGHPRGEQVGDEAGVGRQGSSCRA
jgi:pyruvate dehydrogenase E2 component (dihydrolipoamide acetyltransferase)